MGLLRFLVIFLFIYLVIRFITRTLFPFFFVNRKGNNFHENEGKKEGEITINYIEKKKNEHSHDTEDDYIDYEEIK